MPGTAGMKRLWRLPGLCGSESSTGQYGRFTGNIQTHLGKNSVLIAPKHQNNRPVSSSNRLNCYLLPVTPRRDMPKGLPFRLNDYLELVEWTGRQIREDKWGSIKTGLPSILQRLELDSKQWGYLTRHFESRFKSLVGTAHTVRIACHHFGKKWAHGLTNCQALFSSG